MGYGESKVGELGDFVRRQDSNSCVLLSRFLIPNLQPSGTSFFLRYIFMRDINFPTPPKRY